MAIDTQNDQQDTVANTPDPQTTQTPPVAPEQAQATPAPSQPTPATQTPAPTGQTQPSPQTIAPTASTPNAAATVTNAPAVHPAVQRASLVRDIAETLSGGPQYRTSIDPSTGATTRTQVPLSGRQLGLAIALEAISGSLAGLGARGPNHVGQAAQLGFQQGQQQIQARQAADQQQAQQEFQNRSNALVQKASIAHTNAQTIAAVSEAEQRGADAIDKLAAINRASGILDVSPDLLDNGGQPVTQAEFLAGLHSGKYNSTDTLGPVAGRTEVTDKDGRTHWESTHLALLDPNAKIDLTPEMYRTYSENGVPGFPKVASTTATVRIPIRIIASANEVMASHYLADQRLADLKATLQGTPDADKVPSSIDFTKPGVSTALARYRFYTSHNADNLSDPLLALQQMGASRRNPTTGALEPNPDAKFVDTIAQTFGGWALLSAAHDQLVANKKTASDFAVIDSEAKANAVLAAPKRFTQDQLTSAKGFLALSEQQGVKKAAQDARARAVAEGTDVQAMFRFGKNPITGEVLSLDNAAPSMLVTSSGQVIPQDLVSTYKPSQSEKQTGDTARQVLAISAGLQSELQKNPNLAGPLSGRSKQGLAKLGYGDAQAQKFLDDVSFLQTAATRMHTGRFSNAILDKMGNLIKPGMNPDQFNGALSSINDVASRYADEDKLRTVADFKQQAPMNPNPASGRQVQIPVGAQIGRDGKGNVVGYKLPNGAYVPLGGNQ